MDISLLRFKFVELIKLNESKTSFGVTCTFVINLFLNVRFIKFVRAAWIILITIILGLAAIASFQARDRKPTS